MADAADLYENDLLYDEQLGVDPSLSDSDSDGPEAAPVASHLPSAKAGMDITGVNNASHQSSTLRISLDDDVDSSIPTPSDAPSRMMYPRQIAASMPVRSSTARLGTSAPINIPHMSRWRSDKFDEDREAASTFIPPHQLSRQEDFMFSFTGQSPGAGFKRERLRARNAILRSTGFIEPMGNRGGSGNSGSVQAGGGGGDSVRSTPVVQSSLTAALSTIGENQ